jgi:CDGSH-type Zn-finger protein
MSEELKPCPFCGGTDLEVHGKPGILNAHDDVGCNACDAFTPLPTWNRRAQPAETEGVVAGSQRLMQTLADLARRAPLRTLHTICETQHQVSTVKLERYLEPIGDTLAGYAFELRTEYDKLHATLSAVTAERDRLREAITPQVIDWVRCGLSVNGRLVDGTHPALEKLSAALAAKEA